MSPASASLAFTPIPSFTSTTPAEVRTAASVPDGVDAVGVPVAATGDVPEALGVERGTLDAAGFGGAVATTLLVPAAGRALRVAVGVGAPESLDAVAVRDAAAAFGRATAGHGRLAVEVGEVYLPFIVTIAQRYDKRAGIGTIVALMLPYVAALLIAWVALFVAWFVLGIPLGPGSPIST